jgi:hypothetical protein
MAMPQELRELMEGIANWAGCFLVWMTSWMSGRVQMPSWSWPKWPRSRLRSTRS